MTLFYACIGFVLFVIWGEILHKKGVPAELTRKMVHVAGGLLAFVLPYFLSYGAVIVLATALFIVLLITKRSGMLSSVHAVQRKTHGAILFPVGIALSALLFWPIDPLLFQVSALVLGFADGLSGLGDYFYKHKSKFGSIVFFSVTFGIFYFFRLALNIDQLLMLAVAVLLITLIEWFTPHGFDNITVPIASGGTALAFLI
jgi:dolichol kinase